MIFMAVCVDLSGLSYFIPRLHMFMKPCTSLSRERLPVELHRALSLVWAVRVWICWARRRGQGLLPSPTSERKKLPLPWKIEVYTTVALGYFETFFVFSTLKGMKRSSSANRIKRFIAVYLMRKEAGDVENVY